ncbi:hypothetical protein PDJAM_G00207940 [Pangasius djambal]|uniref:Uncharacterized protein n=1 Tax=Pangasius djambal TaxID=1691987 RepID=A0ACC5Y943_9TELE|nr:hypothetical protein [Pangasius djambal]
MEPPQDNPQSIISSQHDKDVQDLLKQLKDATSKLQRVKSEREEVNMEVHQCREEMDRRMLLLLHVDDRVCDALMELEAAKRKKQTLSQQTLNTHAREPKLSGVCVSVMQKQVEALEEEENKLKLQCEQMKKALDDVQEV